MEDESHPGFFISIKAAHYYDKSFISVGDRQLYTYLQGYLTEKYAHIFLAFYVKTVHLLLKYRNCMESEIANWRKYQSKTDFAY